TNYQDKFDPAIKRAGRFDLLLCMGPPTLSEKLDHLSDFFKPNPLDTAQAARTKELIGNYVRGDFMLRDQLELFTYSEFQTFLRRTGSEGNLGDKVEQLGEVGFKKAVDAYSK